MASLDSVSIAILLRSRPRDGGHPVESRGAAVRRPLLLVFLLLGMLAGEGGPGGVQFDDVRTTYLAGSVAWR